MVTTILAAESLKVSGAAVIYTTTLVYLSPQGENHQQVYCRHDRGRGLFEAVYKQPSIFILLFSLAYAIVVYWKVKCSVCGKPIATQTPRPWCMGINQELQTPAMTD